MTGSPLDDIRCLGFDLETTGVDTSEDRIVTACAVLVQASEVLHTREWLVAVDVDIPEGATAVHGITTEHARQHGIAPDVAVKEIAGAIRYALHSGFPIVAFNGCFDLSMLNAECVRHGLGTLEEFCGRPIAPVLDGFVLDKATDRYRKGRRQLGTVAEHYGVELENAHDATADAVAAVEVVRRLLARTRMDTAELRSLYADRRYPNEMVRAFQALAGMGLEQLHERQVRWYAEQAISLGEYWEKSRLQCLTEADMDVPPVLPELPDAGVDERRQVIREQAAELERKIASLTFDWPLAVAP